ncbi:retrovirus-related pol polyprotein from transposon RE1 [Citrus sinensis]|uniref:Retrovirus-related pol polyprotein from transposon RE1 n=1 Tax=Citrus sinensis TaxID=2711 RepID=A0ACB8L628_CITSI|nr:retrovirus-related pol polyprotein from transposon RE1 [Citrus sinensis]
MASSSNLNTNPNTTNMNQSIQTTFSFITPIKLDRSHYMLWRNQVLGSIRGNRLEGYINGEKAAPTQFLTSGSYAETMGRVTQQVENPEYIIWRSQDQTLLSWLLSSLTEDKLACAGSPVSDKYLLQQILNGLGPGYLDLATFITASKLDFDDSYALLLTHETRLEQSLNEKQMFNANLANVSHNNNGYDMMNYAQTRGSARRGGYNGGFHGGNQFGRNNFHTRRGMFINSHPRGFPSGSGNFGNNLGRGQMVGNNNKQAQFMRGQYSVNSGLSNSDGIPHMYNPPCSSYISDSMSSPVNGAGAAYAANFEGPADEGWYLDSGTTHHLTNNMANMHVSNEFRGNDKLIIGDGKGLSITHVGNTNLTIQSSKIQSASTCIALKDILLVPSITKNLISVSRPITDNDLSVEFLGSVCFVKDILKGKILLLGIAEKADHSFHTSNKSKSDTYCTITPIQVFQLSTLPVISDFSVTSNESFFQAYSSGNIFPPTVVSTQVTDQQSSNTYRNNPSTPTMLPSVPDTALDQPSDENSQNQHNNNISHLNQIVITPPSLNQHPMITRGKAGIFKPKVYTAVLLHKEPDTVQEVINDERWFQAMKAEYDALMSNGTWTLVPRTEHHRLVGNKWVFQVKSNTDGSVAKYKARLVAKGFQQIEGVNYFETFSPVVKAATVRVVLSLAVMNQWQIKQVDVNNVFLNGDLIEKVYMSQPERFIDSKSPDFVCKLHKALYGLKQAPRAWFDKLRNSIMQWGFENSKSDSSLFLKRNKRSIILILIYVDDILITGSNCDELEDFIKLFSSAFALKDLGKLSYYLRIEVLYDFDSVYMSQRKYIRDLLAKVDMLECKGIDTSMGSNKDYRLQKNVEGEMGYYIEDPSHYRSIVGGLQYLVLTRPEIAYSVHKLSELKVTAFTDADWGSDFDDRRSTGTYCVYLGNNLISWSSKKQSVVTKSSAESEYRALAAAVSEITWIKSLFLEIDLCCVEKPVIWCDNVSAKELAHNPVFHSRTKHIEIDLHFIRDKVLAGDLKILYIPSAEQIADIMTKPLNSSQFIYLRNKLNVHLCPLSLRGAAKKAHCAELRREKKPEAKVRQQCQVINAESADSVMQQ